MKLGEGVCGIVKLENGMAVKTIKLNKKDIQNVYKLNNYKNYNIPPPRNCDISNLPNLHTPIPGINPWRELKILEKIKNLNGVVTLKKYLIDIENQELKLYFDLEGYTNLKNNIKYLSVNSINKIYKTIEKVIIELNKLGIIHMDLKPSNIILDNNNNPIICDFGWSNV